MRRVWRYLAALFVALVIVAAVPWLSIGFLVTAPGRPGCCMLEVHFERHSESSP